jgi:hypothetical protein
MKYRVQKTVEERMTLRRKIILKTEEKTENEREQ